MAHTSIVPTDSDYYYAGDAIDIPFEFVQEDGTTPIDLTAKTVEFRIKESLTDTDANAVVTKTGTEGGVTNGVTFAADPTTGQCTVHIDTDDTATVVDDVDTGTRVESVLMEWHARVIDTNGARITSETGSWEMFAS